ncbi:hypothetical protein PIB30_083578 [Stylosanthes scabra]|uniref:Uncharacterized protein n=1 Tax=Stylosanthes scabra TaxID=79078 RepID=A0ABU6VS11_9FABA|nr:hypothetical protein [Stylosanthes scabra]
MVDASTGGALMNKTPEEAWELIESMADNNHHFKVRATSVAKGVFEVTPSESTILAKSLVDIAAMLNEIKEGQAATPKLLTQQANTSQQLSVKHCGNMEKGSLRSKKEGNWSILSEAPRLGVQSCSPGPNHPRLGVDTNA